MTITGSNDTPSINLEVKKYSIKQTGTQVKGQKYQENTSQ